MMKGASLVRRFATSAARLEEAVTAEVKQDGRSRTQKIVDHFKNIIDDYSTVFIEIGRDMAARPVKTGIYLSALGGIGVLFKTNPGDKEFHNRLTECAADLMMVGEITRNPKSSEIVSKFKKLEVDRKLRCYNIGICSIMCEKQYNQSLGLYKAKSKYANPHWTEFFSSIVDVGILGKWRTLEKAMIDYDINPGEWLENGQPNKDFRHYSGNPISWDMKLK